MQATHNALIDAIVSQVGATDEVAVIEAPAVGQTDRQNELLMFAKPEIFMVGSADHTRATLQMFFDKLNEFDAEVHGAVIVGGKALEEYAIMNRHYGFINELSRTASVAASPDERAKISELLGVSLDEYPLYGGHEFLASHPNYDANTLDALWSTKKSARVKGGYYVQAYENEGEKFALVNAFHPVQLSHFTEASHRIALLLIHSDTTWSVLRGQLIGATDPAKADANSIRGALYAEPSRYGFDSVGSGNNGVHLSAGPFEGVHEIINFFGKLTDLDPQQTRPLAIRRMLDAGISQQQALAVTSNPKITVDGKQTDLFGATEDMDTDPAVQLYKNAL